MAFYQPVRHPQMIDPELLRVVVAIFSMILSLFLIRMVEDRQQEQFAPSSALVLQAKQPVYFSKLQGSHSVTDAVERRVPESQALSAALQALLKGPTRQEQANGYYSEIPKGTKLLGVTVRDHLVTVNLSKEFMQGGGATSMLQRVEELKKTVSAIDGRHVLQIAVEGKSLKALGGEGLELMIGEL